MADEPQEPSSEQMQRELAIQMIAKEAAQYAYGGAVQSSPATEIGLSRRATIRQQMVQQAKELEERAKEVQNLIKLFDENPNIEKILNAMRKLGIG